MRARAVERIGSAVPRELDLAEVPAVEEDEIRREAQVGEVVGDEEGVCTDGDATTNVAVADVPVEAVGGHVDQAVVAAPEGRADLVGGGGRGGGIVREVDEG